LADECNRPNCQRIDLSSGNSCLGYRHYYPRPESPSLRPSHPPIPSAGARLPYGSSPRPSFWLWVIDEARVILPTKIRRSTPLPKIFRRRSPSLSKNPRKKLRCRSHSAHASHRMELRNGHDSSVAFGWCERPANVDSQLNGRLIPDGPFRRHNVGKKPYVSLNHDRIACEPRSPKVSVEPGHRAFRERVEPQKKATRSCRSRRLSPPKTTG
jgi:hypothetical protein